MITFLNQVMQVSEAELELLYPILQYRKLKKQDFILKEGDVCRNVYFITEGFFRMYYVDHDGNEINYRFTGRNNFLVDFQSFLMQKPSHFYWQAMHDAEVLVLPYNDIHKLYASSQAWNNFGRLIAERVYLQLNERVEMLLFMTPEERYQHLLDTQPDLFNQVSQFHLSSYLGIKPESLSRLRKRLSKSRH
ncbi:Crp/Fnr family transcriptional regulator [Flavihumibacter solisilvae]|uniref:Crp/Fnr family transcriptional regulator n=1 Tax=Flavihumibacter solisilvae TaxID=1349421 RepID=A0A0C1L7M0_9BACT|nr:Crp/Fnr family transcriptional regulator [Flavihumibacter solisilvae]